VYIREGYLSRKVRDGRRRVGVIVHGGTGDPVG
jgi:hypothetical protein